MSAKKTIDIIIPIYNQEKYLKRCLDSLVCQLQDNVTLILVNDGSTDNSLSICHEYAGAYKSIIIVNKENGGLASARNAGIEAGSSQYIAFVDSDDCVESGYISTINEGAEKGHDLFVFSSCIKHMQWKQENLLVPSEEFDPVNAILTMHRIDCFNQVWNKVYKREILNDNEPLRFIKLSEPGEDLLFNCEYMKRVKRVTCCERMLYDYMRNGEDTLANTFRTDLWDKSKVCIQALESLYDYFKLYGEDEQKMLAYYCISYVHATIPNMYRMKYKFPKGKRIEFYEEILDSDKIKEYFEILDTDNKLFMNLKKIYQKGSAKQIDRHYSFLMFIRNHFSGIYIKIRKIMQK